MVLEEIYLASPRQLALNLASLSYRHRIAHWAPEICPILLDVIYLMEEDAELLRSSC